MRRWGWFDTRRRNASTSSLRAALFDSGELLLHPVDRFSEDELSWADFDGMAYPAPTQPGLAWSWHRAERVVTGPTWGGNLEILQWTLAVGRWIRPAEDYAGCVLIKPRTDFIHSWPAVDERHYVPCAVDFSDLAEKIDFVLAHWDSFLEMRRRNRERLLALRRPEALADRLAGLVRRWAEAIA